MQLKTVQTLIRRLVVRGLLCETSKMKNGQDDNNKIKKQKKKQKTVQTLILRLVVSGILCETSKMKNGQDDNNNKKKTELFFAED